MAVDTSRILEQMEEVKDSCNAVGDAYIAYTEAQVESRAEIAILKKLLDGVESLTEVNEPDNTEN